MWATVLEADLAGFSQTPEAEALLIHGEGHELLAGEMSHRVKNLLAIATGLTNITSQSTTTAKEMAIELTGRLAALRRAHDLVRPLPGSQGRAALLWRPAFRSAVSL
ncbi:histidine kinase (plasmid) [Rhizobium phaseoli Ch24-10]|nr:histidine kinase [Rhizobium phaseoli Ch24-10]